MLVYNINYTTVNTYSVPIREAVLNFLVLPSSENQTVEAYEIETDPLAQYYLTTNALGFSVIHFRLKDISSFCFTLKLKVSRNEVNPYNFNALPIEEENALLASDAFTIDQYFYLSMSAFTLLPSSFDIPKRNIDEAVFTFIQRVNVFVNQFLKFDLAKADPQRKPESIITEKRGVCQDYTHLMLGILRSNSIPSRYVSGYLNQGNALEGSGAIHAWVQALIPGVGWIGFDPTNNLLEDHHYIKIAHGADIDDCTTLKGVIKGSGTNLTDYHVLVEEQNKKETNQ